ncbi:unnamed protein product, partial [marine sediment metagenome]
RVLILKIAVPVTFKYLAEELIGTINLLKF